jgi:hypothetical protein
MQIKVNLHLHQVKCLAKILQIIAFCEAITCLKFYLRLLDAAALLTADRIATRFGRDLDTLLGTACLAALFVTVRFVILRLAVFFTTARLATLLTADRFTAFLTTVRFTAFRLAVRLTCFTIVN